MLKITGRDHSRLHSLLATAANSDNAGERARICEQMAQVLTAGSEPASEDFPANASLSITIADAALDRLNALLPWSSFFVDSRGRVVGNRYTEKKRNRPDGLNDKRIVRLAGVVSDPRRQSVAEYGCFEGNHTAQLCQTFGDVIAIDGRIENCVKTMARTWILGERPEVRLIDLEDLSHPLPDTDICHHVGVLYHLSRPVEHLQAVLRLTRRAILLDTQICRPGQENDTVMVNGEAHQVFRYGEKDIEFAPFAGLTDHAIWLSESTLAKIFRTEGFTLAWQNLREERNGQRLSVIYTR